MYCWLRLKVWFGYAGLKKRFYGTEQDNSQQSNDGLRRLRFARESRMNFVSTHCQQRLRMI